MSKNKRLMKYTDNNYVNMCKEMKDKIWIILCMRI